VTKRYREPTYDWWIREEGLPVYSGYGVTDVRTLELGPWERLGGRGAFIQLEGMEGLTGMYVVEIPPGGELNAERHLYEELLYVLSGRGATVVWNGPGQGPEGAHSFEWEAGALFAPPLNTWHRLHNASGVEPARFLAVTNAPLVMDVFHSPEFVFGCDHVFTDRYAGQDGYFKVGERKRRPDGNVQWDTNFIPNVPGASIDPLERKGAGLHLTHYEMAGNIVVGHMAEWPMGRYHKAHYHSGGAILLTLRSRGYTLLWPQPAGIRPYESGHGDAVVKVDWQVGSVYSPPSGWFHQHFNTGPEPARQLALRYGSHRYGVRFSDIQQGAGVYVSVKEGGSLIEYEDEDPEIRRLFTAECAKNGVEARVG